LKYKYKKIYKLLKRGFWRDAWKYIEKTTRKANIFLDLGYPEIVAVNYNNLDNDIEVLTITVYSKGVYTELRLTYVKNKKELTISVEQSVFISQ
jgi:hypothetical protein